MPIRIDPMVNPPVEVAITVQDPGKMIPFYVHLLGCEPIGEAFGPDFHLWAMRLGGTAIKLMYWKFPLADRDRSDLGLGYQEIAIHVTNLDEFLAECRKGGRECIGSTYYLSRVLGKTRLVCLRAGSGGKQDRTHRW